MSLYGKKNWVGKWIYRTHGYINQVAHLYVRHEQMELIRPAGLSMARWQFSFAPIVEGHING